MANDLAFVRDILGWLECQGIVCWVFGGWAEELRGLTPQRVHGDVDLLYPAAHFARLDRVSLRHQLAEIEAKRLPHKRALMLDGTMVERLLVERDHHGYHSNIWGGRFDWPDDVLSRAGSLRVASGVALSTYRHTGYIGKRD